MRLLSLAQDIDRGDVVDHAHNGGDGDDLGEDWDCRFLLAVPFYSSPFRPFRPVSQSVRSPTHTATELTTAAPAAGRQALPSLSPF